VVGDAHPVALEAHLLDPPVNVADDGTPGVVAQDVECPAGQLVDPLGTVPRGVEVEHRMVRTVPHSAPRPQRITAEREHLRHLAREPNRFGGRFGHGPAYQTIMAVAVTAVLA